MLVPCTRPDILHPCDIMEDVAIAYGYNNIPKTLPKTLTIGQQLPINKLSDLVRDVIAQAGYREVLTWALCARDDLYKNMLLPEPENEMIVVKDAKTPEIFQVLRTHLLPGLLKVLAENQSCVLPIRVFEVSDVSVLDAKTDVGARNIRRVAAAWCGSSSGFEFIHALVGRIMQQLDASWVPSEAMVGLELKNVGNETKEMKLTSSSSSSSSSSSLSSQSKSVTKMKTKTEGVNPNVQGRRSPVNTYCTPPCSHLSFFPGRAADLYVNGRRIGRFGVLHPLVTAAFNIDTCIVSALEFDLDAFTGIVV